ncbi:MAG: sulfur reduction protein DsrS, partial [gamma proteobacterium symbiont of Bathyaustriella thionipta]|nr:sulfur reduction protein DsrS [gamma proteobacterium symbiont of Bathyaustriella thionipta]
MSLTPEDTLRINVLLANKPLALRIDESRMQLLALMADDEICVPLNPDCRDEVYVRKLRELISGHVLGSPGGYPIYLKRWTRMGQMRDESLQELLLLAEPEAVMAVVCAAGLTDELARRAWWSVENAEHARRMLKNRQVVDGEMGSILADYLMEYLPFESEAENIMEDVRLILQKGLIPAEKRLDLWEKSSRKTAYYIGFLLSDPNNLPMQKAESSLWQPCADLLQQVALEKNQTAQVLLRALSAEGQAFISTCQLVLKKPAIRKW